MAKLTLTDLVNLQNENTAVSTINTNSAAIETALENTLSRDGTSPNQMAASLDMNSNQILNLPNPLFDTSPLRLVDLSSFVGGGTVSNIPAGGVTGAPLIKSSGTDYAMTWGSGPLGYLALGNTWAAVNRYTLGIVVNNSQSFSSRNAADSASINLLTLDNNNNIIYGPASFAGGHFIQGSLIAPTVDNLLSLGASTARLANIYTANVLVGKAATTLGTVVFGNTTSGTVTLQPVSGALGTVTVSLPATTGTVALVGGSVSLANTHIFVGNSSAVATDVALSGDATIANTGVLTFASTITAGGPTGSATVAPIITYDAKGRLTTVTSATITPAIGSITGLGTNVATALAVNVGSAGAFVTFNGVLGTPSSGVATNLTGTAASLTAGSVTTNANLTGPITSSGNVTSITSQTGTGTKFVVDTSPTIATPIFTTWFTSPLHIGGSGTTGTQLTFQTTTGSGTTDQFAFNGGFNGATNFGTWSASALTFNSRLITTSGFSTSATNQGILNITGTIINNDGNAAGANIIPSFTGAANGPLGLRVQPNFIPSANIATAKGMQLVATLSPPTGVTIADTNGVYSVLVYAAAAGAVTTGKILYVDAPIISGSLKPTTHAGAWVANQGISGTTTSYGLYIDAQSGSTTNYMAFFNSTNPTVVQASGGLGIGTTSDPGAGMFYTNAATFMSRTKTTWSTGAGASAGTITNAPSVGNPTKWIPVDDNGTTRYIPAW